MEYLNTKYYQDGKFNFPDDNIPFKKKDLKWHREFAEAIYSKYVNDECGISFSKKDEMIRNELYAEGNQDSSKYETLLYEWQADKGEKMSWSNLDQTILPVLPIYRNAFIGLMTDIKHKITANAIDPFSVKKKNFKKSKIWFKKMFGPELQALDAQIGIQQGQEEYVPESREELEMFFELGGYKLTYEAAIEMACNHSFYISRWDDEIAVKLYSDIFANNLGAVRDYVNQETLEVKQRYVNIKNLMVESSSKLDYGDSRYFGEITSWDLIDIKIATQDEPGWGTIEYHDLARMYSGQNGNKNDFGSHDSNYQGDISDHYNNYKILVADLEFAAIYYDFDTVVKDKYGNEHITKKAFGRIYDDEKRKTTATGTKVWHKCKWIIGTDKVFDFGLQNDIPRPELKDANSSFHVYRIPGKSKAELSIGHCDHAQLAYLQMQNHLSKASPPGLAIEWNAIKNITIASKQRDPYEMLRLKNQRGDIVWKMTSQRGQPNTMAGAHPIMELKGGLSSDILKFLELINYHKDAVADIVGIPKTTATAQTEKYQTATAAKLATIGTDKTLKNMYTCYLSLYERTAINCTIRLRDLLTYSEEAREVYLPIIGMQGIDIMQVFNEYSSPASLSVKLEAAPSDEDKEFIRTLAMAAMKPTENGIQIFSYGDALLVERLLTAGNIKYAHMFITYKEAKAEKMDIQMQRENMQLNQQGAEAQEEKKKQNAIEIAKITTDEEIRKQSAISDFTMKEEAQKHRFKIEEIEKEIQLKQKSEISQSA